MTEDEILFSDDPIREAFNSFRTANPEINEKHLFQFIEMIRRIERNLKKIQPKKHVKNWLFEYASLGETSLLAVLGYFVYLRIGKRWALGFTRKNPLCADKPEPSMKSKMENDQWSLFQKETLPDGTVIERKTYTQF